MPVVCGAQDSALNRGALVKEYCLSCHSRAGAAGGLALEGVAAQDASANPEVWEQVLKRVRAGEMPPVGMPRPDAATRKQFVDGLTATLDARAEREPYPGRPVIRRLNRVEYENAVRDLLAIELPLAEELPPDGQAAGFDNIGDALSMSPLLLEQYLKVARRVSELAVGVRDPSPVVEIFPAKGTQAAWQGDGMPFGTRGGVRVRHYFPYDGDYDLRAFLDKQTLTPTEGVRFFRTRVSVPAGLHEVVVTFPDEFAAREGPVSDVGGPGGAALGGPLDVLGTAVRPTIDFRVDGRRVKLFEIHGMTAGEAAFDGQPGPPTLGRIEIAGPYDVRGFTATASRERIFVCTPKAADEEQACASEILRTIVRRAFRRDITPRDVQPFLRTYEATRADKSFDVAITAAVRDVLLAPDFLFRLEIPPSGAAPRQPYRISDFELATRLSCFLWSSIPDDALLDAAARRQLREPDGLEHEVQRMLADPRAEALVDNFADQWLGLRTLAEVKPDDQAYPAFDSALRDAFERETRLFLESVIRENRSVLDLLGADYTYVNERLAQNYGIAGVIGPGFRRVSLAGNPQRGGLLGQGAILMATSHSAKTSPVLRGVWILDNLLNSPPPPPPANVPALDESPVDGRKLTTREQVERHRADKGCASCHARIDPLGFALESFDVIGRWRTEDEGGPIDPSDTLASGETINGFAGLKNHLLENPEPFVHAAVARLMTYALGRQLDARDEPTIRAILRRTEAQGYRFGDLILAIAESVPFQMRQAPGS
ncbi:MAG: DUF1592 domain-containing protein [Acidobacteria bacterium]|nr:DUF1592 domain-containing protein [Acidobacteriota bacterium]